MGVFDFITDIFKPQTVEVPQTTSTVSNTQIPEWMSSGGRQLFEQATQLAETPYTTYGEPRVAGLTPDQLQAMELQRQNVGSYQPAMQAATQYTQQAAEPWSAVVAQKYMNPYQARVMDTVTQRMEEQFAQQRQAEAAKAVGAGAFGGARQGIYDTQQELGRNRALSETLGSLAAQGYEGARTGYEADARRALAAGQQMGSLGGLETQLGQADVAGMGQIGALGQEQAQRGLDVGYQDFQSQQQWPYQQLNFALGALRGVPYNQTTTTQGSGTSTQAGTSALGQLGGLAMTGYGAYKNGWFS